MSAKVLGPKRRVNWAILVVVSFPKRREPKELKRFGTNRPEIDAIPSGSFAIVVGSDAWPGKAPSGSLHSPGNGPIGTFHEVRPG